MQITRSYFCAGNCNRVPHNRFNWEWKKAQRICHNFHGGLEFVALVLRDFFIYRSFLLLLFFVRCFPQQQKSTPLMPIFINTARFFSRFFTRQLGHMLLDIGLAVPFFASVVTFSIDCGLAVKVSLSAGILCIFAVSSLSTVFNAKWIWKRSDKMNNQANRNEMKRPTVDASERGKRVASWHSDIPVL